MLVSLSGKVFNNPVTCMCAFCACLQHVHMVTLPTITNYFLSLNFGKGYRIIGSNIFRRYTCVYFNGFVEDSFLPEKPRPGELAAK